MLYICTMCGGNIEFNDGDRIGVCDSCGRKGTVPLNSNEQRLRQFNRANQYRQRFEFDKALANYEHILDDNETDAEAHWGAFLSRYGIEYVDEYKNGNMKPTFHRMQMSSVLADQDYLSALEYAPDEQNRQVYQSRANEIAEIQREIIKVSQSKEQQYDIFICYKDKDGEERTFDSVKAEEIYEYLTDKGYRVFFSRRTIPLGVQYEPYIFSALQSARVMLVMGSKKEFFTSIWVKNEWSRYLDLIRENSKGRALIPCFWNLDPDEDLPVELSHLQAQDMNRVGALQDLYSGIRKIVEDGREKKTRKDPENRLEFDLKNGETYLRLKNYSDAIELYRGITKEYPEDYRGWWGCIVSNTNEFTKVFEESRQRTIDQWFGYVRTLAEKRAPKEYEVMRNTYGNYLSKVAVQDANKEFNDIKGRISEIDRLIEVCKNKIVKAQKDIDANNQSMRAKAVKLDEKLRDDEYTKKQISADMGQTNRAIAGNRTKNVFRLLWTILLLVVSLYFIALLLNVVGLVNLFGSNNTLSGEDAIFAFIIFLLITVFFSRRFIRSLTKTLDNVDHIRSLKDYIEELQEESEDLARQQVADEENYQQSMAASQKYIENQQAYIAYQNERISRLVCFEREFGDYLASQIGSTYFLTQRCNAIGISQPVDDAIKQRHDMIEYMLTANLNEGGQLG